MVVKVPSSFLQQTSSSAHMSSGASEPVGHALESTVTNCPSIRQQTSASTVMHKSGETTFAHSLLGKVWKVPSSFLQQTSSSQAQNSSATVPPPSFLQSAEVSDEKVPSGSLQQTTLSCPTTTGSPHAVRLRRTSDASLRDCFPKLVFQDSDIIFLIFLEILVQNGPREIFAVKIDE